MIHSLYITRSALGFIEQQIQEEKIRSYCDSRRSGQTEFLNISSDTGWELDDLADCLERSKPKRIVAWNLSVFSPMIFDAEDLLSFLALLEKFSVELLLVEQEYSTKLGGDSFLALKQMWDSLKLERKRENASASREKARLRGLTLGRKRKGDPMQISLLRAEGHSIRSIASITNLSTTVIKRVLRESDKFSQY